MGGHSRRGLLEIALGERAELAVHRVLGEHAGHGDAHDRQRDRRSDEMHANPERAAKPHAGSTPRRYPTPRTVSTYRGFAGSSSILRRRFLMWASTVRS